MFSLISINKQNYDKLLDVYSNNSADDCFKFRIDLQSKFKITHRLFRNYEVFLINHNDFSEGYIVFKYLDNYTIEILDIYITKDYSNEFFFSKFDIFKNINIKISILLTECIANILRNNKFILQNKNNLLAMNLNDYSSLKNQAALKFIKFHKNYDEGLRCNLQNQIFYKEDRIPLTIEDIKYEVKQEYYLNDFSIFLFNQNIPVGYGQVIKWKEAFLIVNFGILKEFRLKGYSKSLLNYILLELKAKGFNDVFIKVDVDNTIAKNLYTSIGFNDIGIYIEAITQIV